MSHSSKEIFSQNILYYMNLNNLTQRETAEIAGVSAPAFSDWIRKKKYPRIDKIEKLANYFGISKSDLIEKQTKRNGNYVKEEKIMEYDFSAKHTKKNFRKYEMKKKVKKWKYIKLILQRGEKHLNML